MNPRGTPHHWLTFGTVLRMGADALMITASLAAAVAIRLYIVVAIEMPPGDDAAVYMRDALNDFLRACPPLVVICLTTFWLCGFYTYGKNYQSKYKMLVVFKAVSLSYLAYGFIEYFISAGKLPIARGVLPVAWLISSVALIAGRVWSEMWTRVVLPEGKAARRHWGGADRVLVIGGAGYIGSALLPRLLENGHKTRLLDLLMFGEETLAGIKDHPNLEIVLGDFRNVETLVTAMQDVDAVIHLGAIVGDPACNLDEELTIDINLTSTKLIAQLAKAAGVRRFVFASTCSVYGASDETLDEMSAVKPISLYGHTKLASERILQTMSNDRFLPTVLRFATIYGLSGRTRFDLVVNLLTAKAKVDGEITVFGGDQWRPFVHVDDAARAVYLATVAPMEIVGNQVFNVGSDEQNYTITEIGEMVNQHVIDSHLIIDKDDTDRRNYRVSFRKIRNLLGFAPKWSVADGIEQVLEALAQGHVEDYTDAQHNNFKSLQTGKEELAGGNWQRELLKRQSSD